jgi:hypothetical protein
VPRKSGVRKRIHQTADHRAKRQQPLRQIVCSHRFASTLEIQPI